MNKLLLCCLSLLCSYWTQAQIFDDYKAFSSGSGSITAVKYSTDGSAFASGNATGMIILRDAASNDITKTLRGHGSAEITHLDFHASGKYLVSTCADGELKVWDLTNGKTVFTATAAASTHYEFAYFTADNQALIYGGTDGKMNIVRPFASQPGSVILTEPQAINCADYSQNGNLMLIGTQGSMKVVDFMSKKVKKQFQPCGSSPIADVKFNHDDSQAACLCADGTLQMFDMASGKNTWSERVTDNGSSTQIAFSPDGKYLVTGDVNRVPRVWDLATKKIMSKLIGHQNSIRSVDFAPNSKFILSGGNDYMIKMWQWRQLNEEEQKEPEAVADPKPTATVVVNKTPAAAILPDIPLKASPKPVTKAEVVTLVEEPPYTPPANFELENERLHFNASGLPDSLAGRKVRTGKRQFLNSSEVTIKIWDNEYQDGDTISLYLNGQWLLKHYMLHSQKKTIKATLDPNGDNFFLLFAHNEGSRPTNTAAVMIYDGTAEHRLALSSDKRTSDMVNLRVKGAVPPK